MTKCPSCRSPSYRKKRQGEYFICNVCHYSYTPLESQLRNQRDKEKPKACGSGKKGKTYTYEFKPLNRDPFDHMKRAMLIR